MNLALLISGSGTTAEAVIKACLSGKLKGINPTAVIASKVEAGGLEKAKLLGIKTEVLNPKEFKKTEDFGIMLLNKLKEFKVDLVSQNGWLPKTPLNVIQAYEGRIINQHPGPLDPGRMWDFGGQGMYGERVMCARLIYCLLCGEDWWTEATTHLVTEEYDQGELLRTERMEMGGAIYKIAPAGILRPRWPSGPKNDKIGDFIKLKPKKLELMKMTEELQKQLLPLEHKNVIDTLRLFTKSQVVKGFKREKPLIKEQHVKFVKPAKELAVEIYSKV